MVQPVEVSRTDQFPFRLKTQSAMDPFPAEVMITRNHSATATTIAIVIITITITIIIAIIISISIILVVITTVIPLAHSIFSPILHTNDPRVCISSHRHERIVSLLNAE